jgi:hypothetical protein
MDGEIIFVLGISSECLANPVENRKSGEQDDGRDPEVNVGEDHGPHACGVRRRVFIRHELASGLIE